jgi:hypothetical protein
MRKLFLLLISVSMVVGGLYLLAAELLFAKIIFFRIVAGATFLVTLGAYLLWEDFIGALLGMKRNGDAGNKRSVDI